MEERSARNLTKRRRSETGIIFRCLLMTVLFLIVAILFFEKASVIAQAGGKRTGAAQTVCYRSIKLDADDSLEKLAMQYNEQEIQSNEQYIEIVRDLNQMQGEALRPGCYLTVVYYP